jgi:toxin ParE1/3/4
MPYRLSAKAEADLHEIWSHLFADSGSGDVADRVTDSITELFLTLAKNPHIGRLRPDLTAEVRSFPVGSYVVFYRIETGVVVVVRVLHGRRDIPSLLGK